MRQAGRYRAGRKRDGGAGVEKSGDCLVVIVFDGLAQSWDAVDQAVEKSSDGFRICFFRQRKAKAILAAKVLTSLFVVLGDLVIAEQSCKAPNFALGREVPSLRSPDSGDQRTTR
jgi:hypothetical protein